MKRVVITGMGIISSIGSNINEFWANCLKGLTVVGPIPEQWLNYSEFNCKIWAPLPAIDFSLLGFGNIEQKRLDKISLLAMSAAFQALDSANLRYRLKDEKRNTYSIDGINHDRAGVFIGTGVGGINSAFLAHSHQILVRQKSSLKQLAVKKCQADMDTLGILNEIEMKMIVSKRYNPFTVSMLMPNAPSANISIKFNIAGPSNTICSACASGTVAIGHGCQAIQSNVIDIAIVGGGEYLYDDYGTIFRGFDIVKTLTSGNEDYSKANRPFDRERSGFLFGEGGAGVLIIEELEHAEKRGAGILAEIVGFSEGSDSFRIMMPEEKGERVKAMLRKVLHDARMEPHEIDYINAHGTGTIANDPVEAGIIEEVFGKNPLVNSTKSLIGHTIGASGAIEAIVSVLSILNQTTHISRNLQNPIRDLNFVTEVRNYDIRTVITQSFAFGGHNAALILKEFTGNNKQPRAEA